MATEAPAYDSVWIRNLVRDIADYPTPGVTFRDITPLLGNAEAFGRVVVDLVHRFDNVPVDRVLGMEARGFILAAALAHDAAEKLVLLDQRVDLRNNALAGEARRRRNAASTRWLYASAGSSPMQAPEH